MRDAARCRADRGCGIEMTTRAASGIESAPRAIERSARYRTRPAEPTRYRSCAGSGGPVRWPPQSARYRAAHSMLCARDPLGKNSMAARRTLDAVDRALDRGLHDAAPAVCSIRRAVHPTPLTWGPLAALTITCSVRSRPRLRSIRCRTLDALRVPLDARRCQLNTCASIGYMRCCCFID